jgi:predicted nucleic acid-binding protein
MPSNAGVLDAGVVLTRLDRRRRSHPRVVALFDRCSRGDVLLYLSTVNLAEVLRHTRAYSDATGLDLVAMVTGFRIQLHLPDAEIARPPQRWQTSRTSMATPEAILHSNDNLAVGSGLL